MRVFLTGVTGYIGGAVAASLQDAGHSVLGLVRSEERAEAARNKRIEPVIGTLDDQELISEMSAQTDATVNAANADHVGAVEAMLGALAGSGKLLLHTSGSSIVGKRDRGERSDDVFDETSSFEPSSARAARVALNDLILASGNDGVRPVIVCPTLIYGEGRGVNPHSIQVPWLIKLAKKDGAAKHIGSGGNIWSNVHIDDLADLYLIAFEKAPAGAFYYAENGENSMLEVCRAISRMLGYGGETEPMSIEYAAEQWGEGPANDTMGSNSRVRAIRARDELGWSPSAPSLIEEIESGCYARQNRP